MIIAPWSDSLVSVGTITTPSTSFQRGFGAANLFDADRPTLPAIFRGAVDMRSASKLKVDFTDAGGAHTATLTAALYPSVVEAAAHLAAQMSAVAAVTWKAWLDYGSGSRYRVCLAPTSGTASLEIATGANAASNALVWYFGFRPQDRAAAASHTGDFAVLHSTHTASTYPGAMVVVDCTSTTSVPNGAFVAGLKCSPAAEVSVCIGSSDPPIAAASKQLAYAEECFDSDVMCMSFGHSTVTSARYHSLQISDPRSEDAGRISAALWWQGRWFDTDNSDLHDRVEFEKGSLTIDRSVKARFRDGVNGQIFASELAPGKQFRVEFGTAPGLSALEQPTLEGLVSALGVNGLSFVALDATNYPASLSRLCRLADKPQFSRVATHTALGRWRLGLTFEVVQVR